MNKAVFLDRDGVIIKDVNLLTDSDAIFFFNGVPDALNKLKNSGFKLIVVSNQTVVARGLATENDVKKINSKIKRKIVELGGPTFDKIYFCPHHPNATLPEYRKKCECRKPRTGMFFQAATDYNIDLSSSYMIGDRITDIVAGKDAGCKTILLESGMHKEKTIVTVDEIDNSIQADFICDNLLAAAKWIIKKSDVLTK